MDELRPRRGPRYTPAQHRARSHDSAHSADSGDPHPAVAVHPLIPSGPAQFVDSDPGLVRLIATLRAEGSFAYDSEFIGELSYYPKLCLIQVATRSGVWLIDPLAEVDLRPFWELLCDPGIEKIVHAGQQDVEPVVRHLDRAAQNVWDTQIAAGLAGLPYPVSLSKLVGELSGAKLGKGLTFTNWEQRPLSAMQLRYAADDVRYLPLIRQVLGSRLTPLGHDAWAASESQALCEPSLYRFSPEVQASRVRGAGSLLPRNLALLRELVAWRDGLAREQDLPPRTFVKDEVLLDLARTPIRSVDKLSRVRGLPRPVENAYGQQLVDLTHKAMAIPAQDLPEIRDSEPTPTERFRADALWAAAHCLCAGRSIDPALVTSRQEIGELYRILAAGEEPTALRLMSGWRRDALGQALIDLYHHNARLEVEWRDDSLRTQFIQVNAPD